LGALAKFERNLIKARIDAGIKRHAALRAAPRPGAEIKQLPKALHFIATTLEEQRTEIERLRAALKRYGIHDPECRTFWRAKCTCGLDAALGE
jgi:hypothetical protein